LKIALAQLNTTVGDLDGNAARILDACRKAVAAGADLVVAPELALTGYPPMDLLLRRSFLRNTQSALQTLAIEAKAIPLLVGASLPNEKRPGRPVTNAAALLRSGRIERIFAKRLLPTYDVFDEDRYFEPGTESGWFQCAQQRIGVTICEDIWNDADYWPERRYRIDPVEDLTRTNGDVILNLSASPWQIGKHRLRADLLRSSARRHGVIVAQCNAVGGNDQLIFDGHSIGFSAGGRCIGCASGFKEDLLLLDTEDPGVAILPESQDEADLFEALALGIRDYVTKCGFRRVLIGLSGGIDSAVVACLAVHALGADQVMGVSMPSRFSSVGSVEDAHALARNLGIQCQDIPIEPIFQSACAQLAPAFHGLAPDVTEENLQSRARGMVLMALSNKLGALVLTTGNKSEMAVGYCTLYGDMCGGLAVIGDVAKTRIYALSRWINRDRECIPNSTLTKPPSAELRENQTDQDSLPPYEVLDAILERYVEYNDGLEELVAAGYDRALVADILRKVDLAEYKRQQAAPVLKVSPRAFGRGRLLPIAQRFREGSVPPL
jgi:NAD+ synthetase